MRTVLQLGCWFPCTGRHGLDGAYWSFTSSRLYEEKGSPQHDWNVNLEWMRRCYWSCNHIHKRVDFLSRCLVRTRIQSAYTVSRSVQILFVPSQTISHFCISHTTHCLNSKICRSLKYNNWNVRKIFWIFMSLSIYVFQEFILNFK
jgi:hypothetical protein